MNNSKKEQINYCGFGKSLFLKPPFWSFQNASCKVHDDNYKQGGDTGDRLNADVGFLWRMIKDANEQENKWKKKQAVYSAIVYFVLVRCFGWLSFKFLKK